MASKKRFASSNIRNIQLIAHIDHGKSSYADQLLAANSIISSRLAGKVRYLDSRPDEQERGITMESSAVSLSYRTLRKSSDGETHTEDYMINLLDTPGHVDFSSEVSMASRLCDGALVLVDAIEGVCTQTITVLRQAWVERLKPILVINKIDRLITELKLAPIEAHHHLTQLVEQVNAVMGSFHAGDRMEDDLRWREERERRLAQKKQSREDAFAGEANVQSEENGDAPDEEFEERDDEDIYFAPESGNVIFSSAIDGWAFRINQFSQLHSQRLGIKEPNLRKVLWGEFYLDPKAKRVVSRRGLNKRTLKPMFVQFVLENIWAVYESVVINNNPDKIQKIVTALGVKVRPQELKSKDTRQLLVAIMSQWLPLAPATFRAVIEKIPAPPEAQPTRLPKMLYPDLSSSQQTIEPKNKLEKDLYSCSADKNAFIVAYVSKMFAVPESELPQNQKKPLTAEEMRERGRIARAAAQQAHESANGVSIEEAQETQPAPTETPVDDATVPADKEAMIGFSRLYSGSIKIGQTLYAILPKYDHSLPPTHTRNSKYITSVKIDNLYMVMGKELVGVDEVPAGNVFGIGGLEGKILRNGTLCGSVDIKDDTPIEALSGEDQKCLINLAGLHLVSAPIVRVALEPTNPADMPKLVEGLRLLNQADPCVETLVQETGEHVILTAGELHLERCLRDLKERFARCAIQQSAPIVPFRETAVAAADMQPSKAKDAPRGTVNASIVNNALSYTIRARPLPTEIIEFLTLHPKTMKRIQQEASSAVNEADDDIAVTGSDSTEKILKAEDFWTQLDVLFEKAGKDWKGLAQKIWAFGPRRIGSNLLIDALPGSTRSMRLKTEERIARLKSSAAGTPKRSSSQERSSLDTAALAEYTTNGEKDSGEKTTTSLRSFDESIDTAFQLATLRGPLCHEPVTGIAYFVEQIEIDESKASKETLQTKFSQVTGSLITSATESFRAGLLDWSPRIQLAMYSCDIQASTDVLGKVYAVVARRRGRIVSEEMKEGTSFFTIKADIPVVESFGFAAEIRKRTSGSASPQLVFNGFELLDQDPFWVPTTEEELEDLGEKSDRENIALKYVDAVRKRKGLFINRKIVQDGEKQRTLKK